MYIIVGRCGFESDIQEGRSDLIANAGIVIYQLKHHESKCYDISKLSSLMALLNSLNKKASFSIESDEAAIQRLRNEARQRLEGTATGGDDLVTVCRLVFDILRLQDKIYQDRHQISA